VAFTPDGTQLATASADGTAQLWSSTTGQNVLTFRGHTGALTSVAFSPDGTRLATASQARDDPIRIWDIRSGDVVSALTGHDDAVWSVAFSPDGTRLVSASRDGNARIWDLSRGVSTLTLYGHKTLVSATFSPDGRRVATGDRDGLVQLWDAGTGRDVLALTGAAVGEGIDSLAFSTDGRHLAVRGDQAVRLYVVPIEDLTALLRSRLTRWWTLEECRRFLNVEECPPNGLQATKHSTRRPAARAPLLVPGPNVTGSIKIVSSMPHGGVGSERTDSIVNAFKMALNEHMYRVGDTSVSYVDMDDGASTGNASASTETINAN
jgi:dipeptidyl aminopeptidase/acylaminoacyl peptidase